MNNLILPLANRDGCQCVDALAVRHLHYQKERKKNTYTHNHILENTIGYELIRC